MHLLTGRLATLNNAVPLPAQVKAVAAAEAVLAAGGLTLSQCGAIATGQQAPSTHQATLIEQALAAADAAAGQPARLAIILD